MWITERAAERREMLCQRSLLCVAADAIWTEVARCVLVSVEAYRSEFPDDALTMEWREPSRIDIEFVDRRGRKPATIYYLKTPATITRTNKWENDAPRIIYNVVRTGTPSLELIGLKCGGDGPPLTAMEAVERMLDGVLFADLSTA